MAKKGKKKPPRCKCVACGKDQEYVEHEGEFYRNHHCSAHAEGTRKAIYTKSLNAEPKSRTHEERLRFGFRMLKASEIIEPEVQERILMMF
jgi:hypothetical protein